MDEIEWLNNIWAEDNTEVSPDLQTLLAATTTKQATLTTIATEYVEVRGIQENPPISSAQLLAQLSGDMSINGYGWQNARNFVQTLHQRGMRTTGLVGHLAGDTGLLAAFNLDPIDPIIQGLGRAVDLRRNRPHSLLSRSILALVVQDQRHRLRALQWKTCSLSCS